MVESGKFNLLLLVLLSNLLLLITMMVILYRYSIRPYLQRKKNLLFPADLLSINQVTFPQLTSVLSLMPFPLAITDSSGNLEYANIPFHKLIMPDLNQYEIKKSLKWLFTSDFEENFMSHVEQATGGTPVEKIEFAIYREDRSRVPVLLSFYPVHINSFLYCMIIVNDLTENEKYNEKIAHLQKLASIGTFAAGIVHEFNNVLTGIKGYSQLARKDYANREMLDKAFSIIESESQRGAELCKNMNYYSSSTKINPEPVILSDIIDTVISLQHKYLSNENIEIVKNIQHVPAAMVDKFQLQQVLLNLIINARHALMPKDGGIITISLSLANDSIHITIEDTGIGIDKENVKRIFDPFYTSKGVIGESVSNYKIKGTGLGLAVSKSIIKKHGGSIEVASTPARGAVFTIKLPFKPANQHTGDRLQPVPDAFPPMESRKPLKVLVVDDEMPIREMLFRALTDMNIMVTLAKNAEEGVTQCKAEKYDVIFLDYVLPEMNGDKLIPVIKEYSPASKIVFISGWDSSPQKKKNLESSVHAWIDKPFNLTQILACLNDISSMKITH